jgi:response regulator RpfG family c-di-GMP phosphodiesterase
MDPKQLPLILCVDDEPRILEGLVLQLRRDYQVYTASSGQVALQTLKDLGGVMVVVSDMRMPGMDGATLLKQVKQRYPETTRILLTGETGREAAVQAINEGQIFRFLTKPCSPDQLRTAIDAGVIQHRLMSAEKVLLQETLIGCIKALVDVLAITNPVAFGRAQRVTRLATQLAASLGTKNFWQLETAAMLSQVGYIALPVELIEKIYYGERLTPEEKILAEGTPQVAHNLLGRIPRLEPVLQILDAARVKPDATEGMVQFGANILRLAVDYDSLIAQGHPMNVAVQSLRTQNGMHPAQLIDQLATLLGASSSAQEIRELPLRAIKPGMVFIDDLRTHSGTLLVPKGFEVTEVFLDRLRNYSSGMLTEKVRVMVTGYR